MANKGLKTIKFPGLDDTYTIPQSYSDVGAASAAHTHSYSDVGAASAAHTHTAADVGAVPTSRTVNGKSLNSNITLSASDVGALPATTHIPDDQVNSDWNATTGVSSILNKPTIPAAQVNANWTATTGVASILNKPSFAAVATTGSYNSLTDKPTIPAAQVNSNWTATTGVASILNKPSIPSTYSDVGAASASHQHGYISNDGKIDAGYLEGTPLTLIAADSTGTLGLGPSITGSTGNANKYLSDKGTFETLLNPDWSASTGIHSILNKPTIPAAQVNANWTATTGVASILNKPSSMTPTAHASTATTYGQGTSSNYGHLKLSNSHSSTSGTDGGIAATPSAVKDTYDAIPTSEDYYIIPKVYKTIASSGTSTITFTSGTYTRGVVVCTGYGNAVKGMYIVTCTNAGAVGQIAVVSASGAALSTSSYKLTIKNNNTSNALNCDFIAFAGGGTIA